MTLWRRLTLGLTFLAWAAPGLADPAPKGGYRLGRGDELRVIIQDHPQLSGTSTLADDGAVSLPALGRLPVAGLTIEEAAAAIRQKLAERLVQPSVAVEVMRYRPFFILGDVANPGSYPTLPGTSVIKAVAAAGGYRAKSDYFQMAVTGIRAAESHAVARQQLVDLRVTQSRLEAEARGESVFEHTPDGQVVDGPRLKEKIAREREILEVRTAALTRQVSLLEREKSIRDDEMAALEARIKSQGRQGEQLRNEMRDVQGLIGRGLSPTSRLNELNREEGRLQSDTLQTSVLLNQARTGRNQAELQLLRVTQERRLGIMSELQDIEQKIARARQQLRADTAVILEATQSERSDNSQFKTVVEVTRETAAATPETFDEASEVRPGDVIRIQRLVLSSPLLQ